MSNKSPMTTYGYEKLQEEVRRLKLEERPKCAKAIGIAREHGDLSENAEYDAAKEAQGMVEGRIRDIESKLATAQVVDVSKLSGEKVVFGATVTISDVDTGDEKQVMIVGEDETDSEKGRISYESPIARALIGKNIDDIVKVKLPAGAKEYEILEVEFAPIEGD